MRVDRGVACVLMVDVHVHLYLYIHVYTTYIIPYSLKFSRF